MVLTRKYAVLWNSGSGKTACYLVLARSVESIHAGWQNDVISKLSYYLTSKSGKDLTKLLPNRWGRCRQSHDTLLTILGLLRNILYTQPRTSAN